MKFLFCVLFISEIGLGAQSSQSGIFFTGSAWAGVWNSIFSQSGFGQTSTTQKNALTPGLEFTFGLRSPSFPVFVELNGTYLLGNNPKTKSDDESDYLEFGTFFGLAPPNFPIEFFVGLGRGTYTFENGNPLSFLGFSYAAGVNLIFGSRANTWKGIRVTARYLNADQDTAGKINSNYTTKVLIYSAGLFVAF